MGAAYDIFISVIHKIKWKQFLSISSSTFLPDMEFKHAFAAVGSPCDINVTSYFLNEFDQLADNEKMYAELIEQINEACRSVKDPASVREEGLWNDYPEYMRPNHFLRIYIPPVLLVLGTIGNVLSFVIMGKNMLKISTYSYLAVLAIMDLMVLYVGLLRMWVGTFSVDVQNYSNLMCKTVTFLGYVSSVTSVWLIIAVTIERFIAVKFPLRAPRMCNVTRARIVIVTVIVAILLLNSHIFWTVELKHNGHNGTVDSKCEASEHPQVLVREVLAWVDAAVYSFVPFIIITILNILIVRQVLYARERRTKLQNMELTTNFLRSNKGSNKRPNESSKKLTCMLLAVSFTFLLTTLPMNVLLIVSAFMESDGSADPQTREKRYAQVTLARTIVELLMYINHSVNFFLYCATGRKFRRQVKDMLCRCFESDVKDVLFRRQRLRSSSTTCSASCRLSRMNSYNATPKRLIIEFDKRLAVPR